MNREKIRNILRIKCCEHFGIEELECDESAYFDDFQCDDLDRVELAIFVEDTFEVEFIDMEIDYRVLTFGELVTMVENKIIERVE